QPESATARTARDTTPMRTTSLIMTSSLALKDLLLVDRDRLAPPPFLAREGDVLTLHARGSTFAVAGGEEEVIARGEVRRVILPRPPLFAAGAARDGQQQSSDQRESNVISPHVWTSLARGFGLPQPAYPRERMQRA